MIARSAPEVMARSSLAVLIVDDIETRAAAVARALSEAGDRIVGVVGSNSSLPQLVAALNPDVIIVDMDSPSRDTLEQISQVSREQPRPIVVFAHDNQADQIQAAIRAGVSAYVVDGLADQRVRSVVDVAMVRFNEFAELRRELQRTKESLEDRKIIERAKGVLMNKNRCSEEDAHRLMQKHAMDQRRRLLDVARDVLALTAPPSKTES